MIDRLLNFIEANYTDFNTFAVKSGIPLTTIKSWFDGEFEPTLSDLIKIYNTGCSLDWLLSGENGMYAFNKQGLVIYKNSTEQDNGKFRAN
ncbi:MAG: helix-turn-helix domain-containing protein [Candidatus Kapabacteria bacterium]|nr:helix-turn-helix domain-containing protein [Candidatus Kapabacteria bacterium]